MLTNFNKEQKPRTIPYLSHADDILHFPNGIVTFSNEDLCDPEPNQNRPLFVSMEHWNKVVRRAIIDVGASTNILPLRALKESGYSLEHPVPTDIHITYVYATTCDSMGTISLHISVRPLSM